MDDLEGGEDNKRGGSRKPRKGKKKMGDRDVVGSLRNIVIAAESLRFMTAVVEGMTVGDPERVSRAGLRNGGESKDLQFRSRLYGLKILQGKNVIYDFLLF